MKERILRRLRRLPVIGELWDEYEQMVARLDEAVAERDTALRHEQAMRAERDAARRAADAAQEKYETAVAERDTALRLEQAMRQQRDAALAERGAAASPLAVATHSVATHIRDLFRLPAKGDAARRRHAVIVPVHGPIAAREIVFSRPFFIDYCRSIGADLRIIEVPGSVLDLKVKASLLPVAREYARVALIDADILIRRGCPDLFAVVPEDRIGAVAEGRWTDRSAVCAELGGMYGLAGPLPAASYIDTGVMVISAAHLPLIERLQRSPPTPHPQNEQGLINGLLHRDGIALHCLPREFNWIPYAPEQFDWRWAWIFHIGDHWRSPPRYESAWQLVGRSGDGMQFGAPVALTPSHCRAPCLIEVAEQLRGAIVRVFHPAEMGYHPPIGQLLLTDEEAAAMWCAGGASAARDAPPIYGPYARLEAGRWSVELLAADLQSPADGDIVADLAYDVGSVTVRWPAPIGSTASFDVLLEQGVTDVEVRLYRGERDYSVGAIVFRRLANN